MPSPALLLGGAQVAQGLYAGLTGRSASRKAAKHAKAIGAARAAELTRQAGYEDQLAIEQEKAQREAQAQRMAQIEGMYAKSGILLTGSPAQAIQKQEETDVYNIEQASGAAAERSRRLREAAKLELAGAGATAEAYKTQGDTDLVSGLIPAAVAAAPFGAIGVAGLAGGFGTLSNWLGAKRDMWGVKPQAFDMRQNYLLEGWQA